MFYQPSVKCCTMLTHSVTLRRWWWMKTRARLANQNIEVTRRGLQDRCRLGRHVSFNPSACPTLGRTSGWKAVISRQRLLAYFDLCSCYSPFILNSATVSQTARRISVMINCVAATSHPTVATAKQLSTCQRDSCKWNKWNSVKPRTLNTVHLFVKI